MDNAFTHTGPYRWVRNPIYISNTLLCVGLTVLSQVLWMVPVTIAWCLIVYTIVIREEENRPQPKLDRDAGKGMTITVGRIKPDSVLDYRFVVLSHNTIRGAAGAAIQIAELLQAEGRLNA